MVGSLFRGSCTPQEDPASRRTSPRRAPEQVTPLPKHGQTALAPLTAYDRLLRKPEDTCGSLSWRSHSLTVQVDDLFMAPCLAGCQMSIPLMHKILQNDPAVCFGLPMSSLLIQHAPTRPQTKTKREKVPGPSKLWCHCRRNLY